ncbi:MAG: hypothetical protein QM831_19090 [Kofleriaceae bacterium]
MRGLVVAAMALLGCANDGPITGSYTTSASCPPHKTFSVSESSGSALKYFDGEDVELMPQRDGSYKGALVLGSCIDNVVEYFAVSIQQTSSDTLLVHEGSGYSQGTCDPSNVGVTNCEFYATRVATP